MQAGRYRQVPTGSERGSDEYASQVDTPLSVRGLTGVMRGVILCVYPVGYARPFLIEGTPMFAHVSVI